jgi:hypothetical protein
MKDLWIVGGILAICYGALFMLNAPLGWYPAPVGPALFIFILRHNTKKRIEGLYARYDRADAPKKPEYHWN